MKLLIWLRLKFIKYVIYGNRPIVIAPPVQQGHVEFGMSNEDTTANLRTLSPHVLIPLIKDSTLMTPVQVDLICFAYATNLQLTTQDIINIYGDTYTHEEIRQNIVWLKLES